MEREEQVDFVLEEQELAREVLLEQIELLKAQVDGLSGEALMSVTLCVIDAVEVSNLEKGAFCVREKKKKQKKQDKRR